MQLTNTSKETTQYIQNLTSAAHITEETRQNITALFDQLHQAVLYCSKINATLTHTSIEDMPQSQMFNSNTLPEEIRQHILSHSKYAKTYTFTLFDRTYHIHFILKDSPSVGPLVQNESDRGPALGQEPEDQSMGVKYVAIWLAMLQQYASNKCVKQLNAYIYLTSLKKQLPLADALSSGDKTTLSSTHINTAFTTSCPANGEILVFREEEWFKVFIHESFHTFGLDFSHLNTSSVHKCIIDIFPINSKINAYEAYTEFWAEIINTLFCSYDPYAKMTDMLQRFESAIEIERTHSFIQLNKVLRYMGLSYSDLYSTKGSKSQPLATDSLYLSNMKYKEDTNVFAYFVLKTILLNNYQGFLKWCAKYNGADHIMQFKSGNQSAFCQFIRENYSSDTMTQNVSTGEKILNTAPAFIRNHLRMTANELSFTV